MVIGIGGISTAGKSKLAETLKQFYSGNKVTVLCQDNFAMPTALIPKINGHSNWEIPESIDFDRFYNKILEEKKINEIVIAEGLFVFYEKRLAALFDKKIFLTISKKTFLDRKSNDLRWGKEPVWYMEHIWNSHHHFCQNYFNISFAFQQSGENPVELEHLYQYLKS